MDKREFSGREILAGEAPQNLRIPVRLHPKVPAGTVIGWCEYLPIQYRPAATRAATVGPRPPTACLRPLGAPLCPGHHHIDLAAAAF
jgi:hypothetical protein